MRFRKKNSTETQVAGDLPHDTDVETPASVGRFARRRAARSAAKVQATSLRDSLHDWWTARSELRKKAAEQARKRMKETSRGVNRVPEHLRGHAPTVEVLVEHTDTPYSDRRRSSLNTGRRLASSTNTPHVNPGRDAKSARAGRLRKELQS